MTERELTRTPALERLLASTRAALVRQVLAYGIGTVLGACTLWLLFAFLADWGLRVPHLVRVLHGFLLLVVVAVFLWRDLLRPWSRLPRREDLAVMYERAHPELRQLLISAVQFQTRGDATQDGDPALIDSVVSAAEVRAASLSPRAVVDPEAPRARLLLGLGGVAGLAALAATNPLHARTFLERLIGGSAPWPQRTHLLVELPGLEDGALVERTPELVRLRLARGSDLALLITADGETPDEVVVHFEGGRDLVLNPTGGRTFRTLLQSCQEDLSFHVTGGDDEDGLPRVELEVLEPPDVEGIALAVAAPEYSELPPQLYFNQDVEVLRGSRVRVTLLPSPPDAVGLVRFLPDDRTVELQPADFPADPAVPGSEPRPGLGFELDADRTVGFRVELTDANGLGNPEPGLVRIHVVEDRAPELTVLAPARGEFETVRGGSIPLRVRAEDDFSLATLGWRVRTAEAARDDGPALLERELEPRRFEVEERRPHGARDHALGSARLEVDRLGTAEEPPAVDTRFELEFYALDRCAPEPNLGRSAPIRVRIVTPEELLRRLQDRLAAARLDALRLGDEQREKRRRVEDLLDVLDGDDPLATGESLALSAALAGQRRVASEAQALARTLAGAAEDVLYARLDDKGTNLLEFYDARVAQARDARFQVAPWRELQAERAAGRLASDGFAATLVGLVSMALEISEDHAAACVAALDAAEKATSRAAVAESLGAASEHAAAVEKKVEALLAELAEWDNFQNVLTLARDILNRQKALHERTQQFATEK